MDAIDKNRICEFLMGINPNSATVMDVFLALQAYGSNATKRQIYGYLEYESKRNIPIIWKEVVDGRCQYYIDE